MWGILSTWRNEDDEEYDDGFEKRLRAQEKDGVNDVTVLYIVEVMDRVVIM